MNLPDEYYRHASQSLKSTNDVYKPVSNIKQPQENLDSMPKASQLPTDDLELVERKRSLAGENCCRSQTMKRVCTASENLKLLELYQRLGKKWKLISTEFPDKSRAAIRARFYSLLRKIFRKISIACRMFPESKFIRKIKLTTFDKLLFLPIRELLSQPQRLQFPTSHNLNTYFDIVKQVVQNEIQFLQCCRHDEDFRDFMKSSISTLLKYSNINAQHCARETEGANSEKDRSKPINSRLSKSLEHKNTGVNFTPVLMHPLMQAFCVKSASFSLNLLKESSGCLDRPSLLEMLHNQITMCNDLLLTIHNQKELSFDASLARNEVEDASLSKMNLSLSNKEFNDHRCSSEDKSLIADCKSESYSRSSKSLIMNESRADSRLSTSSQNDCHNPDPKSQTNIAESFARVHKVSSHSEAHLWNNTFRDLGDSEHFNSCCIMDNEPKIPTPNHEGSLDI